MGLKEITVEQLLSKYLPQGDPNYWRSRFGPTVDSVEQTQFLSELGLVPYDGGADGSGGGGDAGASSGGGGRAGVGQGISAAATGLGLGLMGYGEAGRGLAPGSLAAGIIGGYLAGQQADAMGLAAAHMGDLQSAATPGVMAVSDPMGNIIGVSSPASVAAADAAMFGDLSDAAAGSGPAGGPGGGSVDAAGNMGIGGSEAGGAGDAGAAGADNNGGDGYAHGGPVHFQSGGAAFGVYPSAGRRPERLNQSRDVNVPLQLARGWTAGLLGLPGDVEGMVRMLPGLDETPRLPTSDFYREYLPGYDERPAARALSGLGALTGGAGATKVVRGGLGAVKRATDLNAIRDYVRSAQGLSGLPGTAVVKPKGGNWISGAGSPEEAVRGLKRPEEPVAIPMDDAEMAAYRAQGYTRYDPETGALSRPDPLNQWIDQKLAKYIRNEMGTPEDPVRKLAERDILHYQPETTYLPVETRDQRISAGFPEFGLSESNLAPRWEALSDQLISETRAGDLLSPDVMGGGIADMYLRENPWLAKVPPETPVYHTPPAEIVEDLGFGHLVDELRNATRAGSDLPRELQLRPEQLSKVSMPQAVELVDRINKWRAAQKAEADLARSTNAATVEYKTYDVAPGTDQPNERGLRWVELRAPSNETMPLEERKALIAKLREEGGNPETWPREMLEAALKYEGEVMGHCVGGYCPDVMEGRSRIFSLRDAKGEPHVTIEVRPATRRKEIPPSRWLETLTPEQQARVIAEPGSITEHPEYLKYIQNAEAPPEIVQIKGKGNRAPKEDYLPMVQDFVKSQRWSRVGDLSNTGLIKVGAEYLTAEELKPLVERASQFIEQTPALERHRQAQRAYEAFRGAVPSAEYTALQRAAGEAVHPDIPYTYRELRSILDDPGAYDDPGGNLNRIERLRELLGERGAGYARGGAVSAGPAAYDPQAIERRAAELIA